MEPLNQKKPVSKCDYVVEHLKDKIISGTYRDGDQLPTEPQLCEQYGVSRITIREALKKLNMMGLVDIRQGKGTFVKTVDLSVFMLPLFQRIKFEEVDVEAIYAARAFIEGGTASLAAQNRTEEDLQTLQEIVRMLKQTSDTGDELQADEWDHTFHVAVARIARNSILLACVETLDEISVACLKRHNRIVSMMDHWYQEHYAIYEAIVNQDPDAARKAMELHAQNSKAFLL